jgi:O-antigen/teichoic acid export membrane protein
VRLRGEGIGAVLARGASSFFLVQLLGMAVAFATQVALARAMGTEPYGAYVYVFNWLILLLLFGRLGLGTASLRFVAGYRAQQDWPRLRGYLGTCAGLVTLGALAMSALTAAAVTLLGDRLDREIRATFYVASLVFLPFTWLQVAGYVLRGLKRVFLAQLPADVIQPALVGLGALVLWLAGRALDAPGAMGLTLTAVLSTLAVALVALRHALPAGVRGARPLSEPRAWLRVSLPILLINAVHVSMQRADVIVVGSLLGPADAALYASASRIAGLTVFGLTAVNAWIAPLISDLHARGERAELQRLVRFAVRGVFGVTLPACLVVVAFGGPLLALFGPEFPAARGVLVILAAGQLVNALVGPVGFLMTMTGQQDAAARILVVHALANLAGLALLTPRFGLEGAAIATSVVRASWNLWLLVVVWRRLGVRSTLF